jgi:predicted permease
VNEFWTVLNAVLPVFSIAALGALMRKFNWLTEEADQSLLRVTVNLLLPCLILDSTLGNRALDGPSNLILAPCVGMLTVVTGMGIAWACRYLAGVHATAEQRTFALSVGMYNYGYVPLPLAWMLFGQNTVGVLCVHNVGVETVLWTVGLILLTGASPGKEWHRIFNAPFIAILVGLGLNACDAYAYIPAFVLTITKMLGQCAIPVAIIVIGATIADFIHEFHSRAGWRVMSLACLLRLAVLPLFFLLLAKYLPCSRELKQVIVIEAAMPAAVFPIIIAKHYGGDTPTALRVVLSTSAVSLVTTPLWIQFGAHWVGL